ncbi:hypothetical protein HU200_025563 [Digitaria exilis]|uniref:Uncharacterized protein n=1 Tax=Digitaria exilis TaxID=1010633 RepID=A0A835EW53_9POAL|nr:hypothetical protein HU200_025563 [Digitaria exilis]
MQRSICRMKLQTSGALTSPLLWCQLPARLQPSCWHLRTRGGRYISRAAPPRPRTPPSLQSLTKYEPDQELDASIVMEPTQQGVPLDPSSSQQQPEQQPPPLLPLPLPHQYLPRPLAVQHLLPPEHLPRPLAVQQMLSPQYLPRPLAVQRLPPPSLRLPPLLPQGLALAAAGGVPWQPQQLDGARLHMPMPRPQFHGHVPGVGAAIPFSTSPFLSAEQVDPRLWSLAPAIALQFTLQERRALWDVCHLVELGEGGFEDSSACLVRLLQEGSEDVRAMVFNGLMGALQFVMTSSKWHVVFVELLRASRYYELQRIVDAACEGKVSLPFRLLNTGMVACIENIFGAVKLRPELRQDIINCLLNQGLVQHNKVLNHSQLGKVLHLLRSFFTTFPGEECRVFRSNIFLDKVLQRCYNQLKEDITTRVLENLVNLSVHQFGSLVVQACFLRTGSRRLQLLRRVLTGFLALPDEQFAQLVPDRNAYCLFGELLGAGKRVSCQLPSYDVGAGLSIVSCLPF